MTIRRMEHVGIVVDDLQAGIAFFVALGMQLQGTGPVDGDWVDRVIGLDGARAEIAMLETPDGGGRVELSQFHAPASPDARLEQANAPGIRHLAFRVEQIEPVLERLRAHGGELVGEIGRYGETIRLCYVRGPAGIIVELAENGG